MPHQAPIRLVPTDRPAAPIKMSFTKGGLGRIVPGKRRRYIYDTEARGLAMLITPAGTSDVSSTW